MAQRLNNPATVPAHFKDIYPLHLFLVDKRYKKIGGEKHHRPTEAMRRNTDDGERMLVELNDTAHYATIILKAGVPISVTEHYVRSTVGAVLIGTVEETA